jgi:hypothetical protein
MKFTVASTPLADLQLADIWLRASDPQAVSDASDRIDALLRTSADRVGQVRSDGRWVIVEIPLTVTYELSVDDCKATIVSIRYTP